jgi:hypothetical protein
LWHPEHKLSRKSSHALISWIVNSCTGMIACCQAHWSSIVPLVLSHFVLVSTKQESFNRAANRAACSHNLLGPLSTAALTVVLCYNRLQTHTCCREFLFAPNWFLIEQYFFPVQFTCLLYWLLGYKSVGSRKVYKIHYTGGGHSVATLFWLWYTSTTEAQIKITSSLFSTGGKMHVHLQENNARSFGWTPFENHW